MNPPASILQTTSFKRKELVWAKVSGYPWWPAQISSNLSPETSEYKVQFLGHPSIAYLPPTKIKKYILYRQAYTNPSKSQLQNLQLQEEFINSIELAQLHLQRGQSETERSEENENEVEVEEDNQDNQDNQMVAENPISTANLEESKNSPFQFSQKHSSFKFFKEQIQNENELVEKIIQNLLKLRGVNENQQRKKMQNFFMVDVIESKDKKKSLNKLKLSMLCKWLLESEQNHILKEFLNWKK